MSDQNTLTTKPRRDFLKLAGVAAGAASLAGVAREADAADAAAASAPAAAASAARTATARVAADPTAIPAPIKRRKPAVVDVVLEAREVIAEIEPGVTFRFMTYNGQVPGPMIRVRQGDTVNLTLRNPADSTQAHNVDLHAVMGPGGGALATMAQPGEEAQVRFKVTYPGAFIYHCAVSNMDMHISSGMFGMIVVEPEEGLPHADHEFYLGQHEVYLDTPAGVRGERSFNNRAMVHEQPSYVLINGAKDALTAKAYGPMKVKTGETARVFFVCGGPNLSSSFHPIGNVWREVWPQGALRNAPLRDIQTQPVPPGSTAVATLHFATPGGVKLVDHALSRVVHMGCLAVIQADGAPRPDLFQPLGVRKL
ncbi:copper-containing nitrite reductase precursor [mine drainage metagenome]|uniref:Copper-containing nitrite reductase n=1 Tax=mine drainage metagenome TaxID=410659 RepID=A0A1J5QH67_9ZZZZ